MGISGGVDSALTLAAAIKPELVVLCDVNSHAINYLQYRLELTRQFSNPIDYLRHLFPAKIPVGKLLKIKRREQLYDMISGEKFGIFDRSMPVDWKKVRKGIANIESAPIFNTSVATEQLITEIMLKNGWLHKRDDKRISADADLYTFLHGLVQPGSWLFLKDPKDFLWVKKAWAEGRIKFAKLPIQLLDRSRLFSELKDSRCPPVTHFYLGNLHEYLPDSDFHRMIEILRTLPSAEGMDVIYGGLGLATVKLGTHKTQTIENAPDIRDTPWMAPRSPPLIG